MQRFIVMTYPPNRILGDVTTHGGALLATRCVDEDAGELGYRYEARQFARPEACRTVYLAPDALRMSGDEGLEDPRTLALVRKLPLACFVARYLVTMPKKDG